jgi:hypothetical protein
MDSTLKRPPEWDSNELTYELELYRPLKKLIPAHQNMIEVTPAPIKREENPLGRGQEQNQPLVRIASGMMDFVGSSDWFLWGSIAAFLLYAAVV